MTASTSPSSPPSKTQASSLTPQTIPTPTPPEATKAAAAAAAATTTALSSLPTECLQLILAYHRNDLLLLHSLLLVSRTFFQLTIPLLYQSPFALIKTSNCDRFPYEKSKRQVKLLWLLLCSVNHLAWVRQELPPFSDEFPVLWNPALSEEDIEALRLGGRSRSTSSASKDVQNATRNKTTTKVNKTDVSARFLTVDYLSFYTHHNHSTISDSLPTLFPSLICYHMDQWSSSTDMIRIRATVERALLMHRPEGIVSLAVPITRVKAVQEAVADAVAIAASGTSASAGLSRLRRVEFYDIRQEFSLRDVLAFLRSLRRPPSSPSSSLSPGPRTGSGTEGGGGRMLLTEIKIGGPTDYGHIGKRDLYTILQELSPTLQKIDLTDWRGAIMDLDQIPTEHVEKQKEEEEEKEMEKERHELMCKVDKELEEQFGSKSDADEKEEDITDNSSGDEEEDEDDDEDEDEDLMDTRASPTRTAGWLHKDTGAVAYEDEEGLRHLSLAGETPSVLWGLLGATSAYYDRLETLAASSWKPQYNDGALDGTVAGGQGHAHGHGQGADSNNNPPEPELPRLYWPATMTRLVRLDLKGEIAFISFDMRTLAQCPLLQRLRLDTYQSSSPQRPPPITRIPELLDNISESVCELELVGGWFLADREMDRMGRGGVLPRLRRLVLSHCRTRLEDWEVEEAEGEGVGAGGGRDEDDAGFEERGMTASTSAAVARVVLPDYLQAAMPMQQDIDPSLSASGSAPVSSRTRSHTSKPSSKSTSTTASKPKSKVQSASSSSKSKAKPKPNAATTAATITPKPTRPPSWRHLSTHGLVRAVQNMRDLHYLHLGILIPTPPPPPSLLGTFGLRNLFPGELAMSSPYPTIDIFEGSDRKHWEEEDGDGKGELCLDEKSLLKAFGDQKDEGEGRAFPLEIEVLECRES
ncbi:hypothetical protein BGW39_001143 [Mortierella sp. 14UC]|nr:hypothetical protein BGW39_001143 [Mortierella sp. 14UC]